MKRVLLAAHFQLFSKGSQSILYVFWPLFGLLAPLFVGYITFGQILEENVKEVPYSFWVVSGYCFWTLVAGSLTIAPILFATSIRRRRANLAGIGPLKFCASALLPAISVSILLFLVSCVYVFSKYGTAEAFLRLLLMSSFYTLVNITIVIGTSFVACFAALLRDLKFLSTFLSSYLILATPIFYAPRIPNSKIEKFVKHMNPLSDILEVWRNVLFSEIINVYTYTTVTIVLSFVAATIYVLQRRIFSRLFFVLENKQNDLDDEN